jgi:hypothetical protein
MGVSLPFVSRDDYLAMFQHGTNAVDASEFLKTAS